MEILAHSIYIPLFSTFLSLFWPWTMTLTFKQVFCFLFIYFCFICYRFQKNKISKSVLHETGFSVRQNCIKSGVSEGNSSFISKVNTFQIHLTFKKLEDIQEKTYMWKITVIGLKTLFNVSKRSIAFFVKMMISDQSNHVQFWIRLAIPKT